MSTPATHADLAAVDKDLKEQMKELVIQSTTVEKEDWLNSQVKSMEVNVKVAGVHYRIADYHKKSSSQRREWRSTMIRRIFVDTKVVEEDLLFETKNGKKELRRVVKNMHPLGTKNRNILVGPTIIVAFLESSLANDIKERVRKGDGLELTKAKRTQKDPEVLSYTLNDTHQYLIVIVTNVCKEVLGPCS